MGMNDPVRRLAILYMVKSGRIAKSAGQTSWLRKGLGWAGRKLKGGWHWATGASGYVDPLAKQIRTAVEAVGPDIASSATRSAINAYADSVATNIGSKEADEVRKAMVAAYNKQIVAASARKKSLDAADYRKAYDSAIGAGQEQLKSMVDQARAKTIPLPRLDAHIDMAERTAGVIRALEKGGIKNVTPGVEQEIQKMLERYVKYKQPIPAGKIVTKELEEQLYKSYPTSEKLKNLGWTALGGTAIVGPVAGYYIVDKYTQPAEERFAPKGIRDSRNIFPELRRLDPLMLNDESSDVPVVPQSPTVVPREQSSTQAPPQGVATMPGDLPAIEREPGNISAIKEEPRNQRSF